MVLDLVFKCHFKLFIIMKCHMKIYSDRGVLNLLVFRCIPYMKSSYNKIIERAPSLRNFDDNKLGYYDIFVKPKCRHAMVIIILGTLYH